MGFHTHHSTTVDLSSQQLCIDDLRLPSKFGKMNMGKRLKQELADRGIKPMELCALVPDLDIGTLSAIYTRDSKNSNYAPAIALALGLELRWLITGDGNKYIEQNAGYVAGYAAADKALSVEAREVSAAYDAAPEDVKSAIQTMLRLTSANTAAVKNVEQEDSRPPVRDDAKRPQEDYPERGEVFPLTNVLVRGVSLGSQALPKRRKTDRA